MAAVTVEDCLKIIPNRFELALIASTRAKELSNGAPVAYTMGSKKPEKNTIIALREISRNLLDIQEIFGIIETNLKNRNAFKNLEDPNVFEVKRNDSDTEDLDEELSSTEVDDEGFDDDFDDVEDEDEDDDEYYKNLDINVEEGLED